ncbi:MAG: hypothetical protein HXM75_01385 [Mogibacterium diversum]|nr:hypothetical protein [Mogibacterium diversum]MBF1359133.1 hypothetical protein [Mogibacterium diversum]
MKIMEVSFDEFLEVLGLDTDDLKDNEVETEETKCNHKGLEGKLKLIDEQLDNLFEYNMQRLVRKMIDREFDEFKKVRAKSFELGGDLYHNTIEQYLKRDLTAEETALVDFAFMLAYTNGWYDHKSGGNNDK